MADDGAHGDNSSALNAFRLGWVTAELFGSLRKGLRPTRQQPAAPDYAPRLSVSEGRLANSSERFWMATRRLVDLADALGAWSEPTGQPHPLRRLPDDARRWLDGADVRGMTPAELRDALNNWSLAVSSQLQGRDDLLARALSTGMSLADTYWYLRRPGRQPAREARRSQEDWRNLLSVYRLAVERRRVQELAGVLPPAVAGVIARHLAEWSIGTELYYDAAGRLRRLTWPFRPSHPFGVLARWRRVKRSPDLQPADERAIADALERQTEIWFALTFGLRPAESYLFAGDQRVVIWLGRVLLLGLLLAAVGALLVVGLPVLSALLGGVVVPGLLSSTRAALTAGGLGGWSDVIALVTSMVAAVGALIAVLRPLRRFVAAANEAIRRELTEAFVARRTRVAWDRAIRKQEAATLAPRGSAQGGSK